MGKNHVKVLRKARDLVAAGWCQYMEAATAKGGEVSPKSAAATKFCALGALARASPRALDKEVLEVLKYAVQILVGFQMSIVDFNDDDAERSRADVVYMYDLAIQMAELIY